ncbi:C40 family peptidase [Larsenimonas suaedae]|uniref:NlpC/P60 family protein n=1 Tax=Larsenimonas suaedae TaxID=1851019 RepID=A0ABU1GUR7_9GAMM|nr:NlpC/P60 family protein [Larsenimonas suaedae]MCM2971066.1 NlpC/P60 family protein [Larsenimonas suaedae]MDR5895775.1 NlpC/P60 family protein [Larsenimonas suaedae]
MRHWLGSLAVLALLGGCAAQQPSTQSQYYDVAMPSMSTPKTTPRSKRPGGGTAAATPSPSTVSWATIRTSLMSEYDAWAGTPYRYGGTSRSGVDCSALVQHIFRDSFDIDLPRTTLGQVLEGNKISKAALKPGDLVFFRPKRSDRHVGIYVGEGYFMHASSSTGVRLSKLDNPYWSRYFWQARRPIDRADISERLAMK